MIPVWDRLPAQCSSLAHYYLTQHLHFRQEWLPAYAPEFIPVEYLWRTTKTASVGQPLSGPRRAAGRRGAEGLGPFAATAVHSCLLLETSRTAV